MYSPKNQKKSIPREQVQAGGVILSFAQARKTEAAARLHAFIKSPISWLQENEPIRKAVILEGLDRFRPGIEVSHEHEIQSWKRSTKGVKRI